MPSLEASNFAPLETSGSPEDAALVFPPVTRDHILNCSYDSWYPEYRNWCFPSVIIPLPQEVVDYLGEDGIVLADDEPDDRPEEEEWHPSSFSGRPPAEESPDHQSGDSESEDEDPVPRLPPNRRFPETHEAINNAIRDLGGQVVPKLNWSSPKDATWISAHQNTLKCTSPNDIYLLLKSSSFITHDLDHAFDGCVPAAPSSSPPRPFRPVLVLRAYTAINPSLEFRCFVKHRSLVAISHRDHNPNPHLRPLRARIAAKVDAFFNQKLRYQFPDGSFAFDVCITEDAAAAAGLGALRLVDVNPWAPRTDPLLFTWPELLAAPVARPVIGTATSAAEEAAIGAIGAGGETTDEDEADGEEAPAELRLVERGDAVASYGASMYSGHKLPLEVVEATAAGEGGLRELASRLAQLDWGNDGSVD